MNQTIKSNTIFDDCRDSMQYQERNDCTVKAIKHAFDIDYARAHAICKNAGRQDKLGFKTSEYIAMMNALKVEDVTSMFPGKTVQSALKYCPLNHRFIFMTYRHTFCVKNGQIHDAFVNRNQRILKVWRIKDLTLV